MNSILSDFRSDLTPYTTDQVDRIMDAAQWAAELHRGQERHSGEPFIIHPVEVARTLIGLNLDETAVIAGLLHDVLEDTEVSSEDVERRFGKEVELLVDGVTKISHLPMASKSVQNAETIRKMLFAMIRDIRVILIKLADKLHNMQTLGYLDHGRAQMTATECLEIYAPLAGRMGMFSIKDELEDLALKALNPRVYEQISEFVSEKREERARVLENLTGELLRVAHHEEIDIQVNTRIKHFYSIYQKMKRRNVPLPEIYDLLGIRILCKTEVDCYGLLGLVHKLWKPITGRFKDYIAMPKANRYQSLHTVVMGSDGRLMEIQIRTYEMHETAEYGIAAHWVYKRGGTARPEDLTIISKLRTWDNPGSHNFLDEIKTELLKDSIYLFTPQGDAVELPLGATPIDFAYYIHTEVGHRMQGAKADGTIWPLKKPLRNTQVVEIITARNGRPRLSWLRYCKTHRARSKIRQWLNHHEPSVTIDRNIVVRHKQAPQRSAPPKEPAHETHQNPGGLEVYDRTRVGVKVGKDSNFLITMARCCSPSPGDAIVGYVSRGRGLIVHRRNCNNLKYIKGIGERTLDVEWETISPLSTRRFRLTARPAPDIFAEIEGAIRKQQGHLVSGKLSKNDRGTLTGFFTIELDDGDKFNRVLKNLRTIPAILNIKPLGAPPSDPLE